MLGRNKEKKLTVACCAGLLGLCAQAMDTSGDTRGVEECDGSVTEVQGENLECGEDADARGDDTTGNTAIGNGAKASGPAIVTRTLDYDSFFVKNETTTTETVFRVDPATGRRVEDAMTVTTTTYHWTENAGEDCMAAAADLGLPDSACDQITPGEEIAAMTDEEAEAIVREALSTLSVTRTTYARSEPSWNSRNAAFGNDADARGNDSGNVALGGGARAYGHGEDADDDGEVERAGNIAIGEGADARGNGTGNIAIGADARARGNSIAIGSGVRAANGEIAIGHESMTKVRLGAYNLARHSADISANRTAIATNRASISTNSANITANTQAISQNTQAIARLDRGLVDVDTRVSQVAAMAAALSAVPNAVPDGKFFVGVGVGGSEGESAVAVGVSGRLGEERGVHINAGAAASGGDKSVRAGIGWSF